MERLYFLEDHERKISASTLCNLQNKLDPSSSLDEDMKEIRSFVILIQGQYRMFTEMLRTIHAAV